MLSTDFLCYIELLFMLFIDVLLFLFLEVNPLILRPFYALFVEVKGRYVLDLNMCEVF